MKSRYDIVVVGGGLGGLTAANRLARTGRSVLLVEQHTQLGGLATYFHRKGHIFDVALHGFPVGMKKSLRKYWGSRFAEQVIQVKSIRFHNPQYRLESTFDTADFSRKMEEDFKIPRETVRAFFAAPCEDVSAEFLVARSTGGLNPFPVNGSHTFELKPLDDSGCRWGADISVLQCGKADAREVFVKVSALDSALTRPLFGNFAEKFVSVPEDKSLAGGKGAERVRQ